MPIAPKVIHFPSGTHLRTQGGNSTLPTVVINADRAVESIGEDAVVFIDAGDRDGRQPLFHLRLNRMSYHMLLKALTDAGEVFK